jgi:rhamnosyltransferase subunit B
MVYSFARVGARSRPEGQAEPCGRGRSSNLALTHLARMYHLNVMAFASLKSVLISLHATIIRYREQKMNVVVTSFGSDGDFNPLLAIAGALVRRGVAVTFVANPFYERRIKSTGSCFIGAGKFFDVFAALEANPGYFRTSAGVAAIWRDLIVPSVRAIYPAVRDTVRKISAKVVVSHVISYGGAWAAAETGVASVIVTTAPSAWLSRHQPTVFGNWRTPRILQGPMTMAMRGMTAIVFRRALRKLAIEIGAPVVDNMRCAAANLGVWPEWFRPAVPDDPPRAHMCGFVLDRHTSQPLPSNVESFLAWGEAPIVAGFGSAASLHAADRYRAIAKACEKLGRRCVLIGPSAEGVAPAPNTMTIAAAPYTKVFSAASVIVHHGGFGTCGEALRAGKPSLIMPFAFDQFDTAARLHDAGLGRWLRGKANSAEVIAAALDSILRNASLASAAQAAATKIATAPNGDDLAAELIATL